MFRVREQSWQKGKNNIRAVQGRNRSDQANQKNRYFVVQIEGVAAVAITYIPKEFIEEVKHGTV